MEQIKSYLSRQEHMGNVLLIGEGKHVDELGFYLEHVLKTGNVLVTTQKDPAILRDIVRGNAIHTIYFESGRTEVVKQITDIQVRYLIGQIQMQEDYCGLWELYRERAEYIYIARERSGSLKRDVDRYEVLEWSRKEYPIELSVIIPVYNVEKYLPRCIESLIAWKAPYVEYLFVDDGSVDGSGDLIDAYALKDSRIRHIRKSNGGCASARNLGLKKSTGRYIGFVDADDYVDEKMFYKLLMRAIM